MSPLRKSKSTSVNSKPSTATIRRAARSAFSNGARFSPGSLFSSCVRPSGYLTLVCSKYLALAPLPKTICKTTRSTTRTMCLCFDASSCSRAWPFLISATNSWKDFALPLPNWSTLMLWSVNIFLTSLSLSSVEVRFMSFTCGAACQEELSSVVLSLLHHSYDMILCACVSMTLKPLAVCSLSFNVPVPTKFRDPPPRAAAAFWRRCTNSSRRCLTPAFAPDSCTSGLKFSSKASAACRSAAVSMLARNACVIAFLACTRLSSLRSRAMLISSTPSDGQRFAMLNTLCRTSSSPLNGNFPEIKPYMTTPTAQLSTLWA
mmetsp:Transcript_81507/g.235530  ORF Transcript_81507/g.235530 Transcript_81507/m.235530 type:complete len:318 (-) Transcript_81507:709-1662(-)